MSVADHTRSIVVVSNRGPVAYGRNDEGELAPTKTGGGLASGMRPLLESGHAHWFAHPMSTADREAMNSSGELSDGALTVNLVDTDETTLQAAIGRFANERLWFIHHSMVDLATDNTTIAHDWDAFVAANHRMADHIATHAAPDAIVLIQDYHLPLVARRLAGVRPDLSTVHFSHTPFADPDSLAVLGPTIATELLEGMAAHNACGFHSTMWSDHFEASCARFGVDAPPVFVSPLPVDTERLRVVAASESVADLVAATKTRLGGRSLMVRVDRLEPTKNIVAGFEAYDALLSAHAELVGAVVFCAYVYPSRSELQAYQTLTAAVTDVVARINETWSTPGWQPIELDLNDNYEAAVAGLVGYDVLVVNPIADGLNLVAFEGPTVNQRNGAVVLSTTAGAHDQLGPDAISIDSSNIEATTDAMYRGLTMGADERARRHGALALTASKRTIGDWLAEQIAAAG
jgi:trehalose 6-phosphate synthase